MGQCRVPGRPISGCQCFLSINLHLCLLLPHFPQARLNSRFQFHCQVIPFPPKPQHLQCLLGAGSSQPLPPWRAGGWCPSPASGGCTHQTPKPRLCLIWLVHRLLRQKLPKWVPGTPHLPPRFLRPVDHRALQPQAPAKPRWAYSSFLTCINPPLNLLVLPPNISESSISLSSCSCTAICSHVSLS